MLFGNLFGILLLGVLSDKLFKAPGGGGGGGATGRRGLNKRNTVANALLFADMYCKQ